MKTFVDILRGPWKNFLRKKRQKELLHLPLKKCLLFYFSFISRNIFTVMNPSSSTTIPIEPQMTRLSSNRFSSASFAVSSSCFFASATFCITSGVSFCPAMSFRASVPITGGFFGIFSLK